ncbi:MAG: sulfotransferase [Loktanella sp.]|nr:sulfotransferase [Loktanella sp.]
MPDPIILYGMGATKAGTSWLYRHLHDHPEVAMRAVKEAHYWDTFAPQRRVDQLHAFGNRLKEMRQGLVKAKAAGEQWRVRNHARRIEDMERLIAVLEEDRTDDSRYLAWLIKGTGEAKVVGEITPGYAGIGPDRLARMRDLLPTTRFIYLLRDPVDRLWSHVNMHANRTKQTPDAVLRSVLDGGERHIARMGDYITVIERLQSVIPEDRLLIGFCEEMFAGPGLERINTFLGISQRPGPDEAVNESAAQEMDETLRPRVADYLRDQYHWTAQHMGPLPQRWQDNLRRAST